MPIAGRGDALAPALRIDERERNEQEDSTAALRLDQQRIGERQPRADDP